MNNFSLFTANRMTHMKIMVMAVACATLVAGVGLAARVTDGTNGSGARLETADPIMTASISEDRTVR